MKKEGEHSRSIGKKGEEIALRFLEQNGYALHRKNYGKRCGEIDLIVEKEGCIIFVEVKYRRSKRLSSPEESVTEKKLKRMAETAKHYIYEHQQECEKKNFRFDLIAIEHSKEEKKENQPPHITHYKNILSL